MLDRLGDVLMRDPERGREELRQVLEERIRLKPDESGKFLWAEYALGVSALLPPSAEIMVAGRDFAPVYFLAPLASGLISEGIWLVAFLTGIGS